jgi:hypothetical protein
MSRARAGVSFYGECSTATRPRAPALLWLFGEHGWQTIVLTNVAAPPDIARQEWERGKRLFPEAQVILNRKGNESMMSEETAHGIRQLKERPGVKTTGPFFWE